MNRLKLSIPPVKANGTKKNNNPYMTSLIAFLYSLSAMYSKPKIAGYTLIAAAIAIKIIASSCLILLSDSLKSIAKSSNIKTKKAMFAHSIIPKTKLLDSVIITITKNILLSFVVLKNLFTVNANAKKPIIKYIAHKKYIGSN